MLKVLHGIEAGHITFGLILLVFLVFIATPFLKHKLFNRSRGGSTYLPHAKQEWTPGQIGQARAFLKEKARKDAEAARAGEN